MPISLHPRFRPATLQPGARRGSIAGASTLLAFMAILLPSTACVEGTESRGGGPEEDRGGATRGEAPAPIVNGDVDEGHPAVVALTVSGQAFCSGTLVTPTLVVTAAHCVDEASTGIRADEIEIFFGTRTNGEGVTISALQVVAKPDWNIDDPNADEDIAVVRLAEPGPATPVPLGELPSNGTTLTMVGFGITADEAGDSGTKRITTATIIDRDPKIFFLETDPGATCSGDSGGTALALVDGVEHLVGVHTRSDCVDFMIDERIDAHMGFLEPFLLGAKCEADGQCSVECDLPDPDCPCSNDGWCTADCSDLRLDPDCPPSCGGPGNGCGEGCPSVDPDCPLCVADGRCELGCASGADPDCVQSTVGVASSSSGGEGLGGAGGGGDGADDPAADEGCSITQPGAAAPPVGFAALVAAALAFAGRRRRA